MAYKLNGNVIIDDNGDASLTNFAFVKTPTNVDPTSNETVYGDITLELTDYQGLYESTIPGKFVQFQVANLSSFAAANIVYESGNIAVSNTNVVSSSVFTASETFFFRGRYISNADVFSNYSDATCFVWAGLNPPPDGLGCPYQAGFYIGDLDLGGGNCYYLVVSPNSTGSATCQWKTSASTTSGAASLTDGYLNTYTALNNATHPAGNFTATRTIGGYSDWYLPARNEHNTIFNNSSCLSGGEAYAAAIYWSSTHDDQFDACIKNFATGATYDLNKTCSLGVRAIRRVFIG